MEQPPGHNHGRYDQQPEDLVAPVEAPLCSALWVFGDRLRMWFDARFGHGSGPTFRIRWPLASIGERKVTKRCLAV
jgi:hypothetical protein